LHQNAAFLHGLGMVRATVEDCIDGPASLAMQTGTTPVRSFIGSNTLDCLSGPLFDKFRHAGIKNPEKFPIGGNDLPIAVEDHHHARHGIEDYRQQRYTFDFLCLATEIGAGVSTSRGKVRIRGRKHGQG